jgi:hypothetical protein
MDDYDKLPKVLRQALANSDHNWSGGQCLTELRKPKAKRREQFATAERAAQFIAEADAKKHAVDASRGIVCERMTVSS